MANKRNRIVNVPEDVLFGIDSLKKNNGLKTRNEAFKIATQATTPIDRIEVRRLPKSKKRQVVVWKKWVFEL